MPDDALPDYEPMLAAYHRAFAPELRAMVGTLPIAEGDRVLEMACGDGAYTPWLASRVGPTGSVVAVDLLLGYLRHAREGSSRAEAGDRARFVAASIDRLPFDRGTFDLAWCAQSLFSLPEPISAIRAMAGVVRPGGVVAVLEDDTLHQVLLPWPVELELAIRKAEWDLFRDTIEHPRKFYVGRRLIRVCHEAGLVDIRFRSFATDRIAPLGADERTFLGEYLEGLREQVAPRLGASDRDALDRLSDPDSPDYLPDQPHMAMTIIDHMVRGRVAD